MRHSVEHVAKIHGFDVGTFLEYAKFDHVNAWEEKGKYYTSTMFCDALVKRFKEAMEAQSSHSSKPHRFENTSCSQCGGSFGPGNHGFSHCSDHWTMRRYA